jgi:hypothetical protein
VQWLGEGGAVGHRLLRRGESLLSHRYCARLPLPKASRNSSFSNILLDNETTQTSALSFGGLLFERGRVHCRKIFDGRGEGRLPPLTQQPAGNAQERNQGKENSIPPVTAHNAIWDTFRPGAKKPHQNEH